MTCHSESINININNNTLQTDLLDNELIENENLTDFTSYIENFTMDIDNNINSLNDNPKN